MVLRILLSSRDPRANNLQNNNAQGEYYLTDIVKVISKNDLVDAVVCDYDYRLTGINDLETLRFVEEKLKSENDKVIEKGNWKCLWANQWEPSTKSQEAYHCYGQRFGYEDLSNVDIFAVDKHDIPDHTLLVGGFPCQDYSVAQTLSNSIKNNTISSFSIPNFFLDSSLSFFLNLSKSIPKGKICTFLKCLVKGLTSNISFINGVLTIISISNLL